MAKLNGASLHGRTLNVNEARPKEQRSGGGGVGFVRGAGRGRPLGAVVPLGLGPDDYVLTFQSRFGKAEWLQPYTDKTLIALAQQKGVPVTASKEKIYSQDRNLWHLSHEGGILENPGAEPEEPMFQLTVAPGVLPHARRHRQHALPRP